MKKGIFVGLTVFLLAATAAQAQFKMAMKAGFHFTGVVTEIENNASLLAGYNYGADALIFRNDYIFFMTGLHYYKSNIALIETEETTAQSISFLEDSKSERIRVPLNIGLSLTKDRKLLHVSAHGGLIVDGLIDFTNKGTYEVNKNDLNTMSAAANLGAMVDFSVLGASINYEWGLTNIYSDLDAKHRRFTISFMAMF